MKFKLEGNYGKTNIYIKDTIKIELNPKSWTVYK